VIPGAAIAPIPRRSFALGKLHPAIKLGGLFLGLATTLMAGTGGLALLLALLVGALLWSGFGFCAQLGTLRPWLPLLLLALLVHTLTGQWETAAWHPSWTGFLAGTWAVARVLVSLAWLALYLRSSSLDELVQGITWWLRPASRLGLPTQDLGLLVAVALGTLPVVLGEGRRIQMVSRLRRTGPRESAGDVPGRRVRWRRKLSDRVRLIVPLCEGMGRRAETYTLALRRRRPLPPPPGARPSWSSLLVLVVWGCSLLGWALYFRQGSG
jgi:energy-coupling factor transport system permease protein